MDADGSKRPAPDVSVVMPCLDEAETLGACIRAAKDGMREAGVGGEILIVDNGSTDGSPSIAEQHGARVVQEERRGYGAALRRGCDEATGDLIIMGDADGSYDFSQLEPFVRAHGEGADVIMGTRIKGTILPGAMPWKNRYVGNPALTTLLNALFRTRISDAHCGLRAVDRGTYPDLSLRSTGMEFASEMLIKAAVEGKRIDEVPIVFRPDGRSRPPHLRPWRDGWRHLKLILLFSPSALFLVPGLILMLAGLTLLTLQLVAPPEAPLEIGALRMDFHWAVLGMLMVLVGYQVIVVNYFAKVYAVTHGMRRADPRLERAFGVLTLERVLVLAVTCVGVGLVVIGVVVDAWISNDLGRLTAASTRQFIFGAMLVAVGTQTFFNAFFFSILGDGYERAPGWDR